MESGLADPNDETVISGIGASAFDVTSPDAEAVLAGLTDGGSPAAVAARIADWRARNRGGLDAVPAPPDRLNALRGRLKHDGVDGFLVPLADEYQGEFIPPRAQRLQWLTGFGGSAGLAVVLTDRAAIFVDGRYTLQVRAQVDTDRFVPHHITDAPPHLWIAENAPSGAKIGFDPWLHTPAGLERLAKACTDAGAELVPLDENPLDAVWTDQPPVPLGPVVPHEIAYAGVDSREKRTAIADELKKAGRGSVILSAPDSIAWLLNVRGSDVPNTPLPLSYAIVHATGDVEWFIDNRKLTAEVRAGLDGGVSVFAPDAFGVRLHRLGGKGASVRLDRNNAPDWIRARLEESGAVIVAGSDPCTLPKARKNEAELDGTRAAHVRDGAALCTFLAWLSDAAPKGGVTEISAAQRLYDSRRRDPKFRGVSFETISGSGPNGAIVHYRVSEATDRALAPGDVYLVDSGGQYLDGTTDVTRTVYIGPAGALAPAEVRDRNTRVLKGHIAIATAKFPKGTTGSQLDVLARAALWQGGVDYDHGTGHGVGSYLGVHEGPQRISKVGVSVPLEPGMILSNEPGYYKTGDYGIRIENLVVVRPEEMGDAEREMLSFETITLAPIDRALIEPSLLTDDERAWLNAYHARVRETLSPLVDDVTRGWLEIATAPL